MKHNLSLIIKFTTTGILRPSFFSSDCSACTAENVERVRLAVQQSQRNSALTHAATLNLPDRSIHHILLED
jgi:hypothetical protein